MAIKRNKRFHTEIATSAMSDIMFFLLLFFLILSTLANPNVIKMNLPKPKEQISPDAEKTVPTVVITENNKYYLLKSDKEKNEKTLDEIKDEIVTEVKSSGQNKLKIAGHKNAEYDAVFQVLAIAEYNGWTPSLAYAK